jgi:hypothetical protein
MYRYSLGRKVNSESCAKTVQNDSFRQLNGHNSYKAEQQRPPLSCAHHHYHPRNNCHVGIYCSILFMAVFLFNTVIYVFLLLCLCILTVCLCIFVPTGTLRLPCLRFLRAFASVVRQMPGLKKPAKMGHGPLSSKIFVLFYVLFVFCRSVYCLCVNVYCTTATGWLPNCS